MLPTEISEETWIKIPFHDVDSANVAWHGYYVKYFEVARCELLEKIDYSYQDMVDTGLFWPIADMQIKYLRPAVFNQRIKVVTRLEEWEYRLRIRYEIFNEEGEILTKGKTDQVPVDAITRKMLLGTPEKIIQRIEAAIEKL